MTISTSLHYVTRATARTMRAEGAHEDFGVCSFYDAEGNEVKVFTTPAVAHAVAASFNAALSAPAQVAAE